MNEFEQKIYDLSIEGLRELDSTVKKYTNFDETIKELKKRNYTVYEDCNKTNFNERQVLAVLGSITVCIIDHKDGYIQLDFVSVYDYDAKRTYLGDFMANEILDGIINQI